MNPLLTVNELAAILRLHPNTIYKKAQKGEIPSVRTSNSRVRFIEQDVREWLECRSMSSGFSPLLEEALRTDLSLENYDKLFLKGGVRMSPKGKTWNYPFGSVSLRLGKSGKESWHIYYRTNGTRVRKVVRLAQSRMDALNVLQVEVADAFRGRHGFRTTEKLVIFSDFADQYYENYAKINKESAVTDWYMLRKLKARMGNYELRQINPLAIETFRRGLLEKGRAKSTTNRYLALLGKIMNLAIDWGLLSENPVRKVKFFSEKGNLRERVLTSDEEGALLNCCPPYLLPIVLTALHTGMRRGEILGLRWNQVDLSKRIIRLENTKSGKPRLIPVSSFLIEVLIEQKQKSGTSEYVFPNPGRRRPFQNIKRSLNFAAKKAGIQGLRFHDLRHTFASRLVDAGVDLIAVRELLGHHSVKMTERYTHSNAEQKRLAVECLRPSQPPEAVPNTSEKPKTVAATEVFAVN